MTSLLEREKRKSNYTVTGLELRIQSLGKAVFKKGTLRKGQEVLTWGGGGASKAIQKGYQ